MNFKRIWVLTIMLFACLVAGCTGGMGELDQAEEKEIKEKAIQYIKDKYQKEYVVSEVVKNPATGQAYTIRGNIKDDQNTRVTVIIELPDEIRDTYVGKLWSEELKPEITSLAEKYMDINTVEDIAYTSGTKGDSVRGEIPSVFEHLKNGGDQQFTLSISLRIYEQNGQYEQGIKRFLKELRGMHFHEVVMEIFVSDDELKTVSEKAEENKYTLYRYNISIDDIQKIDIDHYNLDQYKTVLKD